MNEQLPTLSEHKRELKRPLSRRVRKAIDLLANGHARTQKSAADKVGLSEEHLCRALKSSRGQVYLTEKTSETLSNGKLRAARKLMDLLECDSLHVQKDASLFLLKLAGFIPPEYPVTNVHVAGDFYQPGYQVILKRRDDPDDAEIIETSPGVFKPSPTDLASDTQSEDREPLAIDQQGERDDDVGHR
jgi:hypothetical protein